MFFVNYYLELVSDWTTEGAIRKETIQYEEAPALFKTVAQKVFCPQKFAIRQILTAKFLNG